MQRRTKTNFVTNLEGLELSYIAGGACKMVQPLQKQWWFFKRWKTELPYDSAIQLLGLYTQENWNICPKTSLIHIWISIVELFIITKTKTKLKTIQTSTNWEMDSFF